MHNVATCLTCYLQDGLGLAGAWRAIEHTGKATAHTAFFETLLNGWQILLREQAREPLHLRLFGAVEEQGLLLDSGVTLKKATAVGLHNALATVGLVGREQFVLGLASKHIRLNIDLTVDALVLDVSALD